MSSVLKGPLQPAKDITRASRTLEIAFSKSKSSVYLFKKFLDIPVEEQTSSFRNDAIIHYFTTTFYDKGAHVYEVNDYDGVTIWCEPGKYLAPFSINDPVFEKQFSTIPNEIKKQVIPEGIDYYYLFMIGKDLDHPEVRGSARALLTDLTKRADKDGNAVVLECISDHAKSVYEYFGFKSYLTYYFGQHEVDAEGLPDKSGKFEGFKADLMFYHRDGDKILGKGLKK